MAQLSRPFQVAFVGVVVLAAVWLVALRGHSGNPSTTPAAPVTVNTTTAPSAASSSGGAKGKSQGAGSHVYHGAAPGVEGLTKAVAKAHGAVATSEQNAGQLQQKSEQASSASPSSSASSAPAAGAPTTASKPAATASKPSTTSSSAGKPSTSAKSTSGSVPAQERAVERALAKHEVVVILFWDSRGSDDVAVHKALHSIAATKGLHVFVSDAKASQVANFGSITRGIQVYGTPTVLVLNGKGTTITLTGLQDAYTLRQAIAEAQHSRAF